MDLKIICVKPAPKVNSIKEFGKKILWIRVAANRIAPKVLLPGGPVKEGRKESLCQKQLLPWLNGQNYESEHPKRSPKQVASTISERWLGP
jgi:hypothetical protein